MITTALKTTKKQYVKHKRFENLCVIPYIRGRLVFAELAARALEEDEFRRVAVDFPFFMNNDGLLNNAVQSMPFAGSLLIKKDSGTFYSIPFVPNDAACITVAAVQMLKKDGISIEMKCIDDSQVINYPQESLMQTEINITDDYLVFTDGLDNFFGPLYRRLDQSLSECSKDQSFFSEYRAGIVAERLAGLLRQGGKTLFVCEYRLWSLVSRILESGSTRRGNGFHFIWKDLKAAMVIEDPYRFWAHGLLDDYPFTVEQFYNKFKLGSVRLFDKLECIEDLVKNTCQKSARKKKASLSVRRLISFYAYLRARMTGAGHLTPQPLTHLYEAAYSCLGKKIAQDIAKEFLRYPVPERSRIKGYLTIREDRIFTLDRKFMVPDLSEYRYFNTGGVRHSFDNRQDGDYPPEHLIAFVYRTDPAADRSIAESLGRATMSWAIQSDYLIHEAACRHLRSMINRKRRHEVPQKSMGRMRKGIQWKKTISSKALGEDAIYVRMNSRAQKVLEKKMDEYTPVVFIFTNNFKNHGGSAIHDSNITQRKMDLGVPEHSLNSYPPPDYVYSVFHTFSRGDWYYKRHVEKRLLSSITFLYTRHVMGLQRYAAIMKRNARFQCRTHPWSDPEIARFPLQETGAAWAVKYAEHTVIVAAIDSWKPSRELKEYASTKGVRIYTISLSKFKPDFIDRMRNLYFTSTQVKTHPDADRIMERFIN
ncbi:MAG: hypothetical protein AB1499_07495 [Nitrospirota bacterium]